MAEAGQFLEKGSPKLDILKNLFEKYQIFVQNTQKVADGAGKRSVQRYQKILSLKFYNKRPFLASSSAYRIFASLKIKGYRPV